MEDENESDRPRAPGFFRVDAGKLLSAGHGYYAFMGSLTTPPPRTEGVRWLVLTDPVDISAAQLAAFRKLYPMNARQVPPSNGRRLEESR